MDAEYFECPNFAPSSDFYFLPNIRLPAGAAARQPLRGTIHAVHFLQIQTQYFFVTGDQGESPTPHPVMYVAQLNVALHPFPAPRDPSWKGLAH